MIINKPGKYKLLSDIRTGNSIARSSIAKGVVLDITRIDDWHHKVIGSPLMDWHDWEINAEPVGKMGCFRRSFRMLYRYSKKPWRN